MGAWVEVREGESIEQAFRRLERWILKGNRWPLFKPKPTKRRQDCHQTRGQLQHQRAGLARTRQQLNLNKALNRYAYLRRWHERNPYA